MRILEVAYTWPAETFIVRHAAAVVEQPGIDLTFAVKTRSNHDSASRQAVQQTRYPIIQLPNFDEASLLNKILFALKYRPLSGSGIIRDRIMLQAFASFKPDLVHFHFGALATSLARFPEKLGIPYTMSLRGSDIRVATLDHRDYTEKLCNLLEKAAAIHVVSDSLVDTIKKVCAKPISEPRTIRTCVPIPEKAAPPPTTGANPVFVTVGRLHWVKAYHDLVRAMVHLPNATLDIIGDGPEKEHLVYLIHDLGLQDRVHIHGSLPYASFKAVMERATAFIQTSISEGFSNSLAEAMAMGKAVFATNVGGTGEVVRDCENGVIIPIGDLVGMAEKFRMASDMNLMTRLGTAARQSALQHFDAAVHGKNFREFYQQALKRN